MILVEVFKSLLRGVYSRLSFQALIINNRGISLIVYIFAFLFLKEDSFYFLLIFL